MIPRGFYHTGRIILADSIYEAVKQGLAIILREITGELGSLHISIAMIHEDMVDDALTNLIKVQIHGPAIMNEDRRSAGDQPVSAVVMQLRG